MLKGDLVSFSLGEVFQSLAINHHSGTLKISSPGHPEKLIYFDRGEICLFASGSPEVPRLGEILVRMGRLTPERLADALEIQRNSKKLLGEVLLETQLITEDLLRAALEIQIREELYDLFLLKKGTFEFHLDYLPEEQIDSLQKKARISIKTNSVIMEGLRQLDEWALIQKHIKTFDEIFKRTQAKSPPADEQAAALLEQIDGLRPVRELFKLFQGSRFDCSKVLCGLVASKNIRLLSSDEAKQGASEASKNIQFAQAAACLQFASQLEPANPFVLKQLADAFASNYQDKQALDANLRAMRLFFEKSDFQNTAGISDRLLFKTELEESDLKKLFKAFCELKDVKHATMTGSQIATIAQKAGRLEEAAQALEAVYTLDPRDLNAKIQVAALYDKIGDKKRSTQCLEEVAAALEAEKKYKELTKVLRLVLEQNPKRQELKQKINALQVLIEDLEKKKKRRITITGISCICLLLLCLLPLLYEIKAREFLSHAKRLEEICLFSMDFKQAKEAYEELIKSYSFSFKVAEAKEALSRISSIEHSLKDKMETEANARKLDQEERILALKGTLATLLHEAELAEKNGDFHQARDIYQRISSELAEVPATKSMLFPLLVTSDPTGATVSIDGVEIGKTPFVYRYRPGTALNLSLNKASCEPIQQTIEARDQWEIHFPMKRCPLGQFSPVMTIQQPMVISQGRILVACRDGNLYAVDPKAKATLWQRVVGRFGDRISNLEARGDEIYLGTVTGEVTAISASSGKSRWVAKVNSSVIAAPRVSPDGKWVAVGATSGTVFIFSNETGALAARFATENEILAAPLFVGDLLIVGSTDNQLYGYSLEKKILEFTRELSADIVFEPTYHDGAVLATTADGKVHKLSLVSYELLWSQNLGRIITTPVLVTAQGAHVGTTSGHLVTFDAGSGQVLWEAQAGSGPITGLAGFQTLVFATLESGKMTAIDASKKKAAWDYSTDSALIAPPLILDGAVYLGGSSGRIQFIQVTN